MQKYTELGSSSQSDWRLVSGKHVSVCDSINLVNDSSRSCGWKDRLSLGGVECLPEVMTAICLLAVINVSS